MSCRNCGKPLNTESAGCPHCGKPYYTKNPKKPGLKAELEKIKAREALQIKKIETERGDHATHYKNYTWHLARYSLVKEILEIVK